MHFLSDHQRAEFRSEPVAEAGPRAITKGSRHGNLGDMKEVAARDAKNRFGQLLDATQSGPVRVTRKGRAVGVMMSVQQYERLRGAAWERLSTTIGALGKEASDPSDPVFVHLPYRRRPGRDSAHSGSAS